VSSWITSNWAEELRSLWNEYDPIGVFTFEDSNDWPKDEYDAYHGTIIKHLNLGSDSHAIVRDVKKVVTGHIGLTWNEHLETRTNEFATNILDWFETKKPELNKP
jgi:lactate dehydrogenase-like 2-hydroxyacid dehydrogenase